MKKRSYLIVLIVCLSSVLGYSQRNEFGVFGGASGYFGDLNPDNALSFTDPAYGFYYRLNYNSLYSFRLGIYQAKVQAADQDAKYDELKLRNLSFYSDITELSGLFELNFFRYSVKGKYHFSPYGFTGLNVFYFNPKADYQGQSYALRSLGTEGQFSTGNGRTYSLVSFGVPMGLGIKYALGKKITFGTEIGYRLTFTDYIDDVSGNYADYDVIRAQSGATAAALSDRSGEVNNGINVGREGSMRGNFGKNDKYMFAGITLSYTFVPRKCPTFD